MRHYYVSSHALQISGLEELQHWYQTLLGQRFYEAECRALEAVLPSLFGYYLLTLGAPLGRCLAASPTRYHYHLSPTHHWHDEPGKTTFQRGDREASNVHHLGLARVQSNLHQLPIASDSVDVVVLSHALEHATAPYSILREVDRVLIPEGHVIILGFNPWSPWSWWRSLWQMAPYRHANCYSPARLRQQLLGLGIEPLSAHFYHHRLPLPPALSALGGTAPGQLRQLSALGINLNGLCGGYLLLAKKRVSTLTPIKPRRRPQQRWAVGGVVNASTSPPAVASKRPLKAPSQEQPNRSTVAQGGEDSAEKTTHRRSCHNRAAAN